MAKFIKAHNHIINTESISKVEYLGDDIYLGDFPLDETGRCEIDFIPFTFGKIELLSGEEINLIIDLYYPEENQTDDEWYERNRMIIKVSWDQLIGALGDITKVTDYEYRE